MSGYHVGHPHNLRPDEHGMLATAEDVGTFVRALNDGSLFKLSEQEIYASLYNMSTEAGYRGTKVLPNITKTLTLLPLNSTAPPTPNCTTGTYPKS